MGYHRKHPRFEVNFGSVFAGELLAGTGTIINLSVSGCSVASKSTPPAHSVVGLKVQLPDSSWPLEVERAVVRWSRGTTFGLEFESLSESETTRLQQLLQDLDQGPLVVMHRPAY